LLKKGKFPLQQKKRGRTSSVLLMIVLFGAFTLVAIEAATEAATGFSTPTLSENQGSLSEGNGFVPTNGTTIASNQAVFEEADGVDEGLGPLYNAQSCTNCHQNPVTGGTSQVSELRVGHRDSSGRFVNPTILINNGQNRVVGRSLINDRATCAEAQQKVPSTENLRTFRMSLSILGDGFVEAIDSQTLVNISQSQRNQSGGRITGQFIQVPVLEAPGTSRGGRFGWKNQHASLLSFAADAYVNEQGITSRLQPTDATTVCKTTSDPEDEVDARNESDIDHFANFMRATKAPPVDAAIAASADSQAGGRLFSQIGCNLCHVSLITTAPAGTVINGNKFTIPAALGNKVIHPYSDFLLHNVGTGDGIVQNGPQDTANKFRTTPLWGFRTRDRLMHDGLTLTPHEAILRHAGEATFVINNYRSLSQTQKGQVLRFLSSL
jgi:CxxC motif-containing protein (DUF1111 family)